MDENKLLSDKVPAAIDSDGTVASYRLVSDVAAGKLTFEPIMVLLDPLLIVVPVL